MNGNATRKNGKLAMPTSLYEEVTIVDSLILPSVIRPDGCFVLHGSLFAPATPLPPWTRIAVRYNPRTFWSNPQEFPVEYALSENTSASPVRLRNRHHIAQRRRIRMRKDNHRTCARHFFSSQDAGTDPQEWQTARILYIAAGALKGE